MDVKKRGWVKNAAIIFLAVMLVLTFFSNTIRNRSLPEVAAQYSTSGTITARIRGSGTVTANESYEVKTNQSRTVGEVLVRLNDEVNAGDVLIRLTGTVSDELERAQEELRALERQLEEFLLEDKRPDSGMSSINRNVQNARNSLADAQRERDSIRYSEASYNAAVAANDQAAASLNAAEAALRAKQLEVSIAQFELDSLEPPPPLGEGDPFEYEKAEQRLSDAKLAEILAQNTHSSASAAAAAAQVALSVQEQNRIAWTSANDMVRDRQRALEEIIITQSEAQQNAGVDASLEAIKLRELRNDIEKKRAEITELEKDGRNSEIVALAGGIVKDVNISPGNQTMPDMPLLIIEVVDRGYSLSFPVTSEQASRVNIGDSAEVDRGWYWRGEMSATLIAIRSDPQNPVMGRLLHFSVSGDEPVESGIQLNIILSQRSENYPVIVPNNAVRSDTNGEFVLVIMSRSGPLGNRYIATRADVRVLASDDTNTAVQGNLSGWDFVITHSNDPITPGMEVRLVDNPW